ncbi:unnamed protein product [Prunus armeniaca]
MEVGACIKGFRSSKLLVIVVDATHLKSKYKGVMIGDLETDESWHWFFTKLLEVISECRNLVIISDRNVSIENVWNKVFPTAQHGICFCHMKGNMKRTCKLKKHDQILMHFEQATKSYSISEFDCHFQNIKRKEHVAQYLEHAGLHKWSRAHMDGRRCNVMTTNIAESTNLVLGFARMLPVVHLIGEIINLLVKWFIECHQLAMNCTTTFCPNFGEKKLRNRLEDATRMNVIKLNNVQFNVLDSDMDGLVDLTNNSCSCRKFQLEQLPCKYVVAVCRFLKLNFNVLDSDMDGLVDLTNNSCSCRKFQLEQLPCKHVVAVCRFLELNVYSKASQYYTWNTWLDAYSNIIYPVQPHKMWVIPEHVRSRVVLLPMAKVMLGRWKKLRIPLQGEGTITRKCSRHSKFPNLNPFTPSCAPIKSTTWLVTTTANPNLFAKAFPDILKNISYHRFKSSGVV